ncbi:MAG: DNA recombination protein RmuC [Ignavibacteria bacterium]|nr:DNA recombination protein RmuC [Ignavibacteria bacterium]
MTEIILIAIIVIQVLIFILLLFVSRKKDSHELKILLENTEKGIQKVEQSAREEISGIRGEMNKSAKDNREELFNSFRNFNDIISNKIGDVTGLQKDSLDRFSVQLKDLTEMNIKNLENMRSTIENNLKEIQKDSSEKLEKMRQTVDEKLHDTLEKRLGDSFRQVSERLEQVHKGLGEMQNLATGVGKLEKVLSNVKTRGVLGEYQLATLLEQILTPDQYSKNVKTKPEGNNFVEFAIKFPGKRGNEDFIWMPVDSKFPTEDYQSLVDAYEKTDIKVIEEKKKSLYGRLKSSAKDIYEKYIEPPFTTDFGIMFLPFEGLYAEAMREPGLFETVQREYKVVITGPSTLAALLNSLQMGFRTLAIEKRSGEVWELLGAVKTEFKNFGDVLDKTKKKLEQASSDIERAGTRSRAIERKLRDVQELPQSDSVKLLGDSMEVEEEPEDVI